MRVGGWLVVALVFCASVPAARAADKPPNFVLILIDDLGYGDIGPFGATKSKTPYLDRMAKEGMKLTSFYVCPVCTPSRAQSMTGCYAKRVSLPSVLFPVSGIGLSADEHTVAKLLKKAGYATTCIGKWHLGDQPEFLPTRHGFDQYFGLPYSNDMLGRQKAVPLLRDEKVIEMVSPEGQSPLTERYTEEAVKFIRAHKDQPFFLYLPHTAVHLPYYPGAAFRGKSGNGIYHDWVEEVDSSAGRVLDTLRELKLDERTLVLFTSDNGGGGRNGPLRGGKGSTSEGGMRVPTVVRWLGRIPAASTCDAVTANIDILPTFVKLAGGEVPQDRVIDGKDISPLLLNGIKESPHEAFYYFGGNALRAVRSSPWKLVLASGALYNLDKDIGETTDVAGINPDVVKKLQGFVEKIRNDLGAEKPGPGCRPPGRFKGPKPLLLAEK